MSHTPPVPIGNQSPYPLQEPPHIKRNTEVPNEIGQAKRSRWSFLPILTASISAAAAISAVAILLAPDRLFQKS
ncbi:hypothetical protein M0208_06035 [Sphingomonas sp. SUN019]|uniref:hypothetical protein n=1 Tax=Sphingomonas sp. SUN019 TaxID=2937788 RepID=UPI0021647054|nr:hypothetical protein [Sphingomonas sp. SUN019]UVO50097.1 hypothetical protein M0208_06035 [Sphingomonas sp. SUN019]